MNSHVKKYFCFVIILCFFLFFNLLSIANASNEQIVLADKQFAYAESLFAEGDYFRAITEYKRFSFFFPNNKLVEKSSFKIAECFFRAKRWQEAIDALTSFTGRYPQSLLLPEALYLKGICEKKMKRWYNALSTFNEIIISKSNEFIDKAIYQSVVIYIEMDDLNKARQTLSLISPNSHLSESVKTISTGLDIVHTLPEKSPSLAGAFSAILPGAGLLYTERPMDALVAFLLNSTFICAAIELFQHDNYVAGGIVTFFEIGWYTGTIYSSVNSAHKYNKRMKDNFIMDLIERSSVFIIHDPKSSANNLMLGFHF
jgi:outer membrane protein assembly factor BamD (BamD/ComL family)/TM2 domain-containing membrane protein YozV